MTDGEKVAVGARAEALLSDEVFVAACAIAEDAVVGEWKRGETPEAREAAHAKLVGLGAVVMQLKALAAQGRNVAAEIERRRESAHQKRT